MICRKKQNSSFCLKNMFVNFFVGKVGSMSLDVFWGVVQQDVLEDYRVAKDEIH